MSHLSRGLYVAYGALLLWLGYCAVLSARNGSPWSCVAFVAGAGLAVTAAIREGDLEDALRREAVLAERAAHPHPSQRAEDAIDETAAVALAAACCETWWTSAGADHEPTTCTRKDHQA